MVNHKTHFRKATDEQLVRAYQRLGNVWLVAKEFGMCGQSVHERLKAMGLTSKNAWTKEEREFLIEEYSKSPGNSPIDLDAITNSINSKFGKSRLKSNICREAKKLGLTSGFKRPASIRARMNYSDAQFKRCATSKNIHSGAAKSGFREDLGMFFRSSWEANYARYLNHLRASGVVRFWDYECRTFKFHGRHESPFSYRPDFYVEYEGGNIEWHEVKGYLDEKSKLKLSLFAENYPEEKIKMICKEQYDLIVKEFKNMLNFE